MDKTIVKPGIQLAIPVRAVWCGRLYAGEAKVNYFAKQGKKGRFKTAR